MEVGDAKLVLHYCFTIEDGAFCWKLSSGSHQSGIALRPIKPAAGESPRGPTLNNQLSAVAVLLDFVQPAFPGRRGVNQSRDLEGNERNGRRPPGQWDAIYS